MAFFSTPDGRRYFNCFYSSDKQCFSGTFYVMTEAAASALATAYKVVAVMAACVFILELLMPFFFRSLDLEQRDLLFAAFYTFNAVALLPAALLVSTKKKVPPVGHFKFPHPWPGQIPPGRTGRL